MIFELSDGSTFFPKPGTEPPRVGDFASVVGRTYRVRFGPEPDVFRLTAISDRGIEFMRGEDLLDCLTPPRYDGRHHSGVRDDG